MTSSGHRTPAALREAWFAAVAAGDAEALRELLTDDYEVWANGAPPLRGIDATVAVMGNAMRRFQLRQTFEPIESVVAGEWAFERGIESIELRPIADGPAQQVRQRAFLVLRRDETGCWRYARGMTNALPPASP